MSILLRCGTLVCLLTAGCAATPVPGNCDQHSVFRQFYDYPPERLAVLVATDVAAGEHPPYLSMTPARDAEAIDGRLSATSAPPRSMTELGELCGLPVRAYSIEMPEDEWRAFWTAAVDSGSSSFGIGIPGMTPETTIDSVGFAFVDAAKDKRIMTCGC